MMQDERSQEVVEVLARHEFLREIKVLKNNKVGGIDGVNAELIKHEGQRLHGEIIKIVLNIWNEDIMPVIWEEGVMVPNHKKSDRTVCSYYRVIFLLSVGYKILAKILYKRELGDYKAGFRKGDPQLIILFL
ncbi:uncharacterized protein [Palaemon carinicauda]|uniref:uncharacterized protein n=1 Tax=Palaemon carinicauda TaxID=392227 RepID=UPI0035B59929